MKIELLGELYFYTHKNFETEKMLHDMNFGFLGKI